MNLNEAKQILHKNGLILVDKALNEITVNVSDVLYGEEIVIIVSADVDGIYKVNQVREKGNHIETNLELELDEDGFADWWAKLKQTIQKKQLNNGGKERTDKTVFDAALRRHDLEWGGNIDGFVWKEA